MNENITVKDLLSEFTALIPPRLSVAEFYDWCDETDLKASSYSHIKDEDMAAFAAKKCDAFDRYIRNAKNEKRLRAVITSKRIFYFFLLWFLDTSKANCPKTKSVAISLGAEFEIKERKVLVEMKKSSFVLKKVKMTEEHEEALFRWIDEKDIRGKLPPWSPTLDEIANFVEPAYARLIDDRRSATTSSAVETACRKQRELLLFLLWIQETTENLKSDVSSYISRFVRERTIELY
ncbi:MAG: hypothetical protein IKA41_06315 [Bacteroidaceae bacterium]|nr:hypothetical protein [Bacteroidaceae bacterium]